MGIRIAITDDHPMVRQGLSAMLATVPGMEVIAQYASGNALLAGVRQDIPDVLLLDIHLPDMTGSEVLPRIHRDYPAIRTIIVTSTDSAYLVKSLLDAGARGYMLKTAGQEQLSEAIGKVMDGEIYLSPEVKDVLLKNTLRQKTNLAYNESLSDREVTILQLIAGEHTSQEISEKMHLSPRTIENYRLGLMQKLDVKNLAGLVRKAILMGIVK